MKTSVVTENDIAFVIESHAYGVNSVEYSVSFGELKRADVGHRWECPALYSNIIHGRFEEQATMVYKKDNGCAILFESWGTTEDTKAEPWTGEPVLIWFKFAEEG